ncbi:MULTISPECIES: hypothetical protein [Alphaproteobacteria]|uniref:hypothetical protein n=1 Tax=Alphaproteobacteria TaxID=28211 RepID=UPI00262BF350|nr:hypothetical protein [Nitratireductor sp.]MCV0349028.1 hypothetical protein [Nitratireductor sp.]
MTHPFYGNKINADVIQCLSDLLSSFQQGRVSLPALASKIDAARSALMLPEKDWLDSYSKLWGSIEECNALALDVGQTSVLPEHKQLLDDAVIKLQSFFSETFPAQDPSES